MIDNYTATGIAEGFIECEDEDTYIKAWQHLIDTGLCWSLQGFLEEQQQHLLSKVYVKRRTDE